MILFRMLGRKVDVFMIMYEDEFPIRLSQLRMQKGVSAREMSLSLGQNPGYINNIETGKNLPSLPGFFYICEYLHVTPAEFFEDNVDYPPEMRTFIEQSSRLDRQTFLHLAAIVNRLTGLDSKKK